MTKTFVPAENKPIGAGFTKLVFTDVAKIRFTGGPIHNSEYYPDSWALYRTDVPSLTDDEWWACPTGWKETE